MVFADVNDPAKLGVQSLPGTVMTSSDEPLDAGETGDRLASLLRLALRLSGSTYALAATADGVILADEGGGLGGATPAELARRAIAQVRRPNPATATGTPLLAAAPILDSSGALLGVLAVAGGPARSRPEQLAGDLAELATLARDEFAPGDLTEATREELQTLSVEVDHRVKNVLASVQAIASQSARRAASLDGFLKAFTGRLKAMASAQELLTATRWRGASIHDLATATLSTLAPGQTRWEGPELFLTPRAANALALALHELAVNAVRHGALSNDAGSVQARWRETAHGGFELDWIEAGGPQVSPPVHKGFGSLLLQDVTGRELDGDVFTEFRASGVRVRITGSAKALASPEPRAQPARPAGPPPAQPITAGASEGPPALTRASGVRGMRVIIVEDAILLAMELEAGLADAGAEIVGSAGLLEEAMALVDLPMDAAVLDCNLHGASVEPMAAALAARGVPFLFATGYGDNQGAPEGFDAPIIRKPYDVRQIAAALAALTGRG